MSWHHLWVLFKREVKDLLRSQSIVVLLFVPVVLSWLFTLVGQTRDQKAIALGVVEMRGEDRLGDFLSRQEGLELTLYEGIKEARSDLEKGEILAVLLPQEGFMEQVREGFFPPLEILFDRSRTHAKALTQASLDPLLREIAGQEYPVDLRFQDFQDRQASSKKGSLLFVMWLCFIVMTSLTITSSSMMEEREQRTMGQLMSTPLKCSEILWGKVLVATALCFFAAILTLGLHKIIPTLLLCIILIVGCLFFSVLGTLIGLYSDSQATANGAVSALFVVFFAPIALTEISRTMGFVGWFSPTFYLHRDLVFALAHNTFDWMVFLDISGISVAIVSFSLIASRRLRHLDY